MSNKNLSNRSVSGKNFRSPFVVNRSWFNKFWVKVLVTIALLFSLSTINKPPALSESLPVSKIHPLPASLSKWQDPNQVGDYFELIDTTPVGYLIWSQFPIKIYFEQSQPKPKLTKTEPTDLEPTAQEIRSQQWQEAIEQAIAEWQNYLPLQIVTNPESADILVEKSIVSRTAKLNPETGLYDIPRTITAQTNYEFYLKADSEPKNSQQKLAHKMSVKISPELSAIATLSAARHELGHALGIWGHSNSESDALYFSQVRSTPQISPRDINTLKKIYQQPSKLGWQISELAPN